VPYKHFSIVPEKLVCGEVSQLMPNASEQFSKGGNVPFSEFSQVVCAVFIVIFAPIGILGHSLVLNAIVRSVKTFSARKILLVSLLIADLVYCITEFTVNVSNLINNGWWEGFGFTGCVITYIIYWSTACSSVVTLLLCGLELYLKIFYNYYISARGAVAMLFVVWSISLGIPLIVPLAAGGVPKLGSVIQLVPSMNGCLTPYHQTDPVSRGIAIFVVSTIILTCGVNFYINLKFLIHFLKANREGCESDERNDKEFRLVMRTIVLSTSFLIFWGPYAVNVVYRLVTGKETTRATDGTLNILVLLNPVTNPILLFVYDPVVGQLVKELPIIRRVSNNSLGLKKSESNNLPSGPNRSNSSASSKNLNERPAVSDLQTEKSLFVKECPSYQAGEHSTKSFHHQESGPINSAFEIGPDRGKQLSTESIFFPKPNTTSVHSHEQIHSNVECSSGSQNRHSYKYTSFEM
jgi:hypothetical protein